MTVGDLEHFREILLRREDDLHTWVESSGQASDEDRNKVRTLLGQIKEALIRVEDNSYGICKECHDAIEHFKLEVQPVSQVCLDCISDSEKVLLQEELYLASKIHRALLPQTAARIDGYDMAVKSIAARNVGGDYFDFLSHDNGPVRIVVADTMGKGLPAGLLMSNIQGTLSILAEIIESPAKLLYRLNSILCRNLPVTKFASMVCLSVRPDSSSDSVIQYANAGHNHPILLRENGKMEFLEPTGGVIGVHAEFEYEQIDITLRKGDTIIIYTDGVTEAVNGHGEMFGVERLSEFLLANAKDGPDMILENLYLKLEEFTGRSELSDDCTVLILRKS